MPEGYYQISRKRCEQFMQSIDFLYLDGDVNVKGLLKTLAIKSINQ